MESLLKLCEIQVAINICKEPDVLEEIFCSPSSTLDSYDFYKYWKSNLQMKLPQILNFFSPRLMDNIYTKLIPFIGLQMLKWERFLLSHCGVSLSSRFNSIKKVHFTSKGMIDEEKTAREFLKEQDMSSIQKYKIACWYCFDDIIPDLWQEVRKKQEFSYITDNLPIIWSHYLDKTKANFKNTHFFLEVLYLGILKGNFAAFKYGQRMLGKSKYFHSFNLNYTILSWWSKLCFSDILPSKEKFFLSRKFEVGANVLEFSLGLMKKKEIQNFLSSNFQFSTCESMDYYVLYYILHKPCQHSFMNTAVIAFKSLDETDFHQLVYNIVELIDDPDFGHLCNYHILLKEFLSKSPSNLKQGLVDIELKYLQRNFIANTNFLTLKKNCFEKLLLTKLTSLINFTTDDEDSFQMILHEIILRNKHTLLVAQEIEVCEGLVSHGRFRLLNDFVESLNLDDEALKAFKRKLSVKIFPTLMNKERVYLVDQFVNWTTLTSCVKDLKQEIFFDNFKFADIACLFMEEKNSITYINEIFKGSFVIDSKINHFKLNGVFDKALARTVVLGNYKPERIDLFFNWMGYSKEKKIEIKKDILHKTLPEVLGCLFWEKKKPYISYIKVNLIPLISYLCSENEDQIYEYFGELQAWCKNHIVEKLCAHCFDRIWGCKFHNRKSITFIKASLLCSSLLKRLLSFVASNEINNELENSQRKNVAKKRKYED